MVYGAMVLAPAFLSVDKFALRKHNRLILSNVGEMWGNYIGALFERQEFIGHWPYNSTAFANNWTWFDDEEDWYNPGFLKHVDNIADITTSEIFSCMTSSTTTINRMVEQLKTKTENDGQVDNAYNRIEYNDWP